MAELLIIADDLTGAIDTGVQLSKQNIQTGVVPNLVKDYNNLFENEKSTVLVVNTESRHIAPEEAAQRVEKVMIPAMNSGMRRFYKKTDSTLRGNIGAELRAFKKLLNQRFLGFIPAHPKLNRVTIRGHHFVDKIPLHKTSFANDPLEPITQNNIALILSEHSDLSMESVGLDPLNIKPKSEILIFDCEWVQDLRNILDFLVEHDCADAISGSAAIVELLPQLYQLHPKEVVESRINGPLLLINGSINEISRYQIKFAIDHRLEGSTIPTELLEDPISCTPSCLAKFIEKIKKAYDDNGNYILSTTSISDSLNRHHSKKSPLDPVKTAENVGKIIEKIIQEIPYTNLAIFGGDTLMGIAQSLGCDYIEPKSEIIPGVAISLFSMNEKQLNIITKPGGYGEEDIILDIYGYLNSSQK